MFVHYVKLHNFPTVRFFISLQSLIQKYERGNKTRVRCGTDPVA